MRDYFIRRFLLILPTLIGATIVVFGITRITPGGPMEKAMQRALMNEKGNSKNAGASLSEEQREELAAYYGFDKSFFPAYCVWLGVWPRNEAPVTLKVLLPKAEWKPNNAYKVTPATVTRDGKLNVPDTTALAGWKTRA